MCPVLVVYMLLRNVFFFYSPRPVVSRSSLLRGNYGGILTRLGQGLEDVWKTFDRQERVDV